MNVKTMYFYKVLGLLPLPAVMLFCYFLSRDDVMPFDCASEIHLYSGDKDQNGNDVFSSLKINFHIPSKNKGVVTEFGVINVEGNRYILDRVVHISIFHESGNSYELVRQKPVKNPRDNLPAAIYEKLVSKQESLFYDIRRHDNDTLIFSDSKRILFVCKKK